MSRSNISTEFVFPVRTYLATAIASDPESALKSLDKEYTPLVKRLQKFQRRAPSDGATQRSVKQIPTKPRNANLGHRDEFEAVPFSKKNFLKCQT